MMNQINFVSIERLSQQRLVRFICSLFLVNGLTIFAGGCIETSDSSEFLARGGHEGRGRDFHHSPNHNGAGNHHPRNGYSQPGGGPSFHSPHHSGGHNTQHGPSDRNHNLGRPHNGRG